MYKPNLLVRLSRLTLVSTVLLIGSTFAQTRSHSLAVQATPGQPAVHNQKQAKATAQASVSYNEAVAILEEIVICNGKNSGRGSGNVGGPRGKTVRLTTSSTVKSLGNVKPTSLADCNELQMETLTIIAQALVEIQPMSSQKSWSSADRRSGIVALGKFFTTLKYNNSSTGTYLIYSPKDLKNLTNVLFKLK